ncbi:aspartate aminotransferase family protein [Tistrella bauzanensis]|uniref:Aspartate aminotransferase family protein n=1 Tax=Tistrella arctica TaxID=3133430 RepID=A0ABU9YR28_9PROT
MSGRPHRWVNQHAPAQILPKALRGEGVYLHDADGRQYIDGSGGPALFCLGHSHPEVLDAMREQLGALEFGYSTTFTTDAIDALSELLVEQAGGNLTRVSYISGGSEANETAMKLALQCQRARGFKGRTRFIARNQSWHGYTLGTLSLSGHPARRAPYEQALLDVIHISAANAYRPIAGAGEGPEGLAEALANEFEQALIAAGPETVAAFFFEPVVGAAGGAVPAPAGYARRMREVCDRHGVLMVSDEVMCGVGRCEAWRALAVDGVEPDIMTIAKGLGGGYMPIGAAIYSEQVYQDIIAADGKVATVHTYSGHTLACAASLAVQTVIRRDGLVEKCRADGLVLHDMLTDAFGDSPFVGDIRGRGFFRGIELVADRATRAPFAPDLGLAAKIAELAFQNGLICYPSPGTADGVRGDHVLLAPPFIASHDHLAEIVDKLKRTVDAVLPAVKAA